MRTLYFDLSMGAAGDMLTGALMELLPDRDSFVNKLNNLGIYGVTFVTETSEKLGVKGTHVKVMVGESSEEGADGFDLPGHGAQECQAHMHHHNSLYDIENIVHSFDRVPAFIKTQATSVYKLIAKAEAEVHKEPVNLVHFHEVGALDAVADVTAVCLLINELKVDRILASPIHVGSGTVKCAHGILPVPAPATEKLLEGIPYYSGEIKGELCTPTGAALLKFFVDEFVDDVEARGFDITKATRIGHGMGFKDFEKPNCVRAYLFEG